MYSRDKIILGFGVVVTLLGIAATLSWSVMIGVIAVLVMSLLVLSVLLLQRMQLAKVQQRTLSILQADKETRQSITSVERSGSVATKKIIGLLQAQQISMEILNDKIEDVARKYNS